MERKRLKLPWDSYQEEELAFESGRGGYDMRGCLPSFHKGHLGNDLDLLLFFWDLLIHLDKHLADLLQQYGVTTRPVSQNMIRNSSR